MILTSASVIAFGGGWYSANRWNTGGEVKTITKIVKVVEHQGDVNAQVAQVAQAHQDQIRTVTKTLVQQVPVYVNAQADADCTLHAGTIRLLDAAASGTELPATAQGPGDPDDAPSPFKLDQVAASVVGNYGLANAERLQLIDLQDWIRKQGLADK